MPAGQTDKFTPEQTAVRLAAATYQGTPVYKYFQHIPAGHPLAVLEKEGGTIFRYEFTDEYKALKAARPKDHRVYDWVPGYAPGQAGVNATLGEEIPAQVDMIQPEWTPYDGASTRWGVLPPYEDWGNILDYPFKSYAWWYFYAIWRDESGAVYMDRYWQSEWVDEDFLWDNGEYTYWNCCRLTGCGYKHQIPPDAYGVAGAYKFTSFYCHKHEYQHDYAFPAGFFVGYSAAGDVIYFAALSTVHPIQ